MQRKPRSVTGYLRLIRSLMMAAVCAVAVTSSSLHARGSRVGETCGLTRWAVKTLDAPQSLLLSSAIRATTIEYLDAQRPRFDPRLMRVRPIETTLWRVRARLIGYKIEVDSDYHLILQSPTSMLTLIGEIPAPYCSVRERNRYIAARAQVNRIGHHRATRRWWWLDYRGATAPLVRVTGYGFYDYEHGQVGASHNDVEIHPVLDVQRI